jgi:hypothetical protein
MKRRLDLIGDNFSYSDDMSNRRIDYEVGVSNMYGF